MTDRTYTTLEFETIPAPSWSPEERRVLRDSQNYFAAKPDWGVFGNFWRPRVLTLYKARGLTTKRIIATPLYRILEDHEMRLATEQGEARSPEYRDDLAILIVQKFKTRRAFCKATGLSEDLLSHVLAGRKHFAIDTLGAALKKIGFRLAIVPEEKVGKKRPSRRGRATGTDKSSGARTPPQFIRR